MGLYINLGCIFEFRTQKLPYERILGNFSDFIDFGHQVRVCEKRTFLNIIRYGYAKKGNFPILTISKCMGFT